MADVLSILQAVKKISVTPTWTESDDQRLWINAPLEIEGITIESLNLRARVYKNRPEEDVLFQLEFNHDPKRNDKAIERIDWRPLHTHDNKGVGPENWRFVTQKGSHYHKCELNWLTEEKRLKSNNLPIAEPILTEIINFAALLVFAGENFRISNIDLIEQPGWQPLLL